MGGGEYSDDMPSTLALGVPAMVSASFGCKAFPFSGPDLKKQLIF